MNYKKIFTALSIMSAAMGCSAIQAQEPGTGSSFN